MISLQKKLQWIIGQLKLSFLSISELCLVICNINNFISHKFITILAVNVFSLKAVKPHCKHFKR